MKEDQKEIASRFSMLVKMESIGGFNVGHEGKQEERQDDHH